MPSIECSDPWTVGGAGDGGEYRPDPAESPSERPGTPNSDTTPSMSTISSGFRSVGRWGPSLACTEVASAMLPGRLILRGRTGAVKHSATVADGCARHASYHEP